MPDSARVGRRVSRLRAGSGRIALLCGGVLACVLAAGCSVDQQVTVHLTGSGEAQIHVELQPVFIDYLIALAEVAGDSELSPEAVFDVAEVERAISEHGVRVVQIATPSPAELELRLAFDDLQEVFAGAVPAADAGDEVVPLISLTGTDRRTLRVRLDSANYHQLTTLFPLLEHPLLASLGPQPDLPVTDDEYLEMMQFVLGDAGPPAIADSQVTVRISVDGRIVEQQGGELLEDGSVLVSIPLLRILVLDQPLDYTVVFE